MAALEVGSPPAPRKIQAGIGARLADKNPGRVAGFDLLWGNPIEPTRGAPMPDPAARRTIARKCLELLQEQGIAHLTLPEIAAAAGVEQAELEQQFTGLADVLDAAIAETYRQIEASLANRLPVNKHPIDLLIGVLEVYVDYLKEHDDQILGLVQLWATASATSLERAVERGRKFLAPLRVSLVHQIEGGIRAGSIRRVNAGGVVDMVLTLVDGAIIQLLVHNTDLDRMFRTTRDLLTPLKTD
jgi:AcrR family transcriptional regulator